MKRGKPEPDDWITYLSTYVNANVSLTIVLFSSIILISVVIFQIYNNETLNIIALFSLIVLEGAIFIVFLIRFNRAKKFQDLLHKIMLSELTTHEEILKEYLKLKNPKEFRQ